jgi:Ca-activated chloride channel family protein
MKYFTAFATSLLFLFSVQGLLAQDSINASLNAGDTVKVSVLKIFPKEFPNVSVVFKAESRKGVPLWGLKKEAVRISENTRECQVVSLEPVSKNKAINLSVVVDHSGSMMMEGQMQLYDSLGNPLFKIGDNGQILLPADLISPMENAKSALRAFVSSFDFAKDQMAITGFAEVVDDPLPLTKDAQQLRMCIDSFSADGSTAFYDAVIKGIDELQNADGIKVLVAMTDGQDNSSKASWEDVVNYAVKKEIPVYIIGLGYVNTDTLSMIAERTAGKFYYTRSSSSLSDVYAAISRQVQSFYDLVYSSPNLASADSSRQLTITFVNDTLNAESGTLQMSIPITVLQLLKEKETEREYLIYGGIAVATVIAGAALLFYFRRSKKKRPEIKRVWPNPGDGNLNFQISSGPGNMELLDLSGKTIADIRISGMEMSADFSKVQPGTYMLVITSEGMRSNAMKVIIQ